MSELDIPVHDPVEVRDAADRILSGPEFRDDRSLLQRAIDWVVERLGDLFDIFGGAGGGMNVVVVALLVLIALLLLGFAGRALTRVLRERQARDRAPGLIVVLGEAVDPEEFAAQIAAALAAGRWKAALLAHYRLSVSRLIDFGVLGDVAGRTTGEYRAEFAVARSGQVQEFDRATELFELAFYGDVAVGEEEAAEMHELTRAVLARAAVTA